LFRAERCPLSLRQFLHVLQDNPSWQCNTAVWTGTQDSCDTQQSQLATATRAHTQNPLVQKSQIESH
jgi:histidine ammonia-lyase